MKSTVHEAMTLVIGVDARDDHLLLRLANSPVVHPTTLMQVRLDGVLLSVIESDRSSFSVLVTRQVLDENRGLTSRWRPGALVDVWYESY